MAAIIVDYNYANAELLPPMEKVHMRVEPLNSHPSEAMLMFDYNLTIYCSLAQLAKIRDTISAYLMQGPKEPEPTTVTEFALPEDDRVSDGGAFPEVEF